MKKQIGDKIFPLFPLHSDSYNKLNLGIGNRRIKHITKLRGEFGRRCSQGQGTSKQNLFLREGYIIPMRRTSSGTNNF